MEVKQQRIKMDHVYSIVCPAKMRAIHEFGNTIINKMYSPQEIISEFAGVGITVDVLPFNTTSFGYWGREEDNCWKVVKISE